MQRTLARLGPAVERCRSLGRKDAKLEPHQKQGFAALLSVENADIALMCEQDMPLAVRKPCSGCWRMGSTRFGLPILPCKITGNLLHSSQAR